MRLAIAPLFALLTACASSAPAPAAAPSAAPRASSAPSAAPAAPAAPAVDLAPAPYTAAQIRDASPAGRRIVFKVEEPDKPVVRRVIEFTRSDAGGADIQTTVLDDSGKVLDTKSSHATWEELRSHGEFPKNRLEIKHRVVSVPLGTVECNVYKVTGDGPDPEVTTFYFAEKMPGPPVFFHTDKGGKRTRTSTMESNTTSAADAKKP